MEVIEHSAVGSALRDEFIVQGVEPDDFPLRNRPTWPHWGRFVGIARDLQCRLARRGISRDLRQKSYASQKYADDSCDAETTVP